MEEGRDPEALELRSHLLVLWRRRRTILLTVFALVTVAVTFSLLREPVYEAQVEVLLQQQDTESLFGESSANDQDPTRKIETEIEVVKSEPVRAAVQEAIGPVPRARVSPIGDSDIIAITARSTDRGRAAQIASAYATAYIEFRRTQAVEAVREANRKIEAKIADFQSQIDGLNAQIGPLGEDRARAAGLVAARDQLVSRQALFKQRLDDLQVEAELKTGGAQVVTRAGVPTTEVGPGPVPLAILAAALGFLLGICLALVLESLDDSIKTKDDVVRVLPGVPILGLISTVQDWKDPSRPLLVTVEEPSSPAAESYRGLRTSLQFIGVQRGPTIIQVTSANAGEGKTATVANLAVVLTRANQRVIVVDGDLRRARVHDFFGLSNDLGLTSLLLGQATVATAARPVPGAEGLRILASGPLPPNPSELLSSPRMAEVLAEIREECDIVLVDSPPLLPVTDSAALSVWVEATVLVVRAYATRKRDLGRAAEILLQAEAPLVGAVLNNVQPHDEYSYASSYYYGSDLQGRQRRRALNGRVPQRSSPTLRIGPERPR